MRCDFCDRVGVNMPATIDGKTIYGPWAGMCDRHHKLYGVGLGTGKGTLLRQDIRPLEFPVLNPFKG